MSRPPVFQDLTFDAAAAAVVAGGRLLLVDVTADWCQPCKQMDQTTWLSPDVVKWLSEKTLPIQLAAESDDAKQFKVQSVPTIIALRDGKELDRVTGSRNPTALLEWLNGLETGKTELDRLRSTPRTNLQARLSLARILVQRGLDDEATGEFAWLWEHSLEVNPSWVGVRSSFLIAALVPLVKRSAHARERFAALRETAEADLASSYRDWVTLSGVLGDEEKVLAWLKTVEPAVARNLGALRDQGTLWMIERNEAWATLGRLIDEPLQLLREEHERVKRNLEGMSKEPGCTPEVFAQTSTFLWTMLRGRASMLVRGLKAVDRKADAEALVAESRRLDPSPEMEAALAGQTVNTDPSQKVAKTSG